MHLTLLLLDFEIVETIPLAKRRHTGPCEECVREECSEACEQLGSFRDGSDMYLTEQQYAMVKYVGLNFIVCLHCFYYF
jgi:hypothetical protein